jgi:lysophospholipase L1-like esterase
MHQPSHRRLALPLAIALAGTLAMRAAPVTVWLAGDSTMAPKAADKRPETGWGEAFAECFAPSRVRVANHAMNGRSTRSFAAEGRWAAIVDSVRPGDYVLIQFGHNDQKVATDRGATPAVYAQNLGRFVDDVRARRAMPVLLTPVTRRSFTDGQLVDSHGDYPAAVRAVAKDRRVPLIDMHRTSMALVERYGADSSRSLWLQLEPGQHPNYPTGVQDNTHFNPVGARVMAGLAIDAIRELGLGLRRELRSCPARP